MNDNTVFTADQIEKLRNKVLSFLKDQPGYEKFSGEKVHAFQEDLRDIGVVFGSNMQAGIAGFGSNEDQAYEDFVRSWYEFKGFEWIEANK